VSTKSRKYWGQLYFFSEGTSTPSQVIEEDLMLSREPKLGHGCGSTSRSGSKGGGLGDKGDVKKS
jgi:hypothetical protein